MHQKDTGQRSISFCTHLQETVTRCSKMGKKSSRLPYQDIQETSTCSPDLKQKSTSIVNEIKQEESLGNQGKHFQRTEKREVTLLFVSIYPLQITNQFFFASLTAIWENKLRFFVSVDVLNHKASQMILYLIKQKKMCLICALGINELICSITAYFLKCKHIYICYICC